MKNSLYAGGVLFNMVSRPGWLMTRLRRLDLVLSSSASIVLHLSSKD